MARFGVNDADKYGGQGGAGYFSLKNDKDTARVRFLFDSIEDVEGYAVHQVEIDGKKRYVNCLREYGQPITDCPFCAAKMFTSAKYFVPIYNIDEDRNQTWERGKKFGAKLSSMCARYPHLMTHVFEIERNGKAGDTATTYEIYEVDNDPNVSLEDFEVPEVLGTIVLDKSPEEMEYFLDYGEFPSDDKPAVRRRGSERTEREPERTGRRTPAGGRRETF
jgi:hypothetical protein